MKKIIVIFLLVHLGVCAQNTNTRINEIKKQLNEVELAIPNIEKKVNLTLNNTTLPSLLNAIAKVHTLNFSVDSSLNSISISETFSDTSVKNVLLYLCKRYELSIDVLGNILYLKKYIKPVIPREIPISFSKDEKLLTADLKNDDLSAVLKKITDATQKNIVYQMGLGDRKLTGYVKKMPLQIALNNIALMNDLELSTTKEGVYIFQENKLRRRQRTIANANQTGFYFKVLDTTNQKLEVDFFNASIKSILEEVSFALKVNLATSDPLKEIGKATIKSDAISFKELLSRLLEDTSYSFSYSNNIYFFGTKEKNSVRQSVVIPLMSRSIEMMMEPMQSSIRSQGNNGFFPQNTVIGSNGINNGFNNTSVNSRINPASRQPFSNDYNSKGEALLSILPKAITENLSIKVDVEQNSFIVNGDALQIEKFRQFLKEIDKPVPVVLIEVMIVEVNKSKSISAGLDLGIGETPESDKGTLLSDNGTNITLGAQSINKIIGGLNGFGSLNLGRVTPNFYARIQALETNGNIKVKSTPKLSTLNGHEAVLSNGERSYYAIRQINTIGTQNPQNIETVNYVPTDADLSIKIRPFVSGDGNITLSINVLQSSFNGERIAQDAPPGLNSREFTSTIRVKDKDVVILGGLEEDRDSKTGSGIPFLARIPIIKWLFSKRVRTKSTSKLSVFIKPTIIKN